MIAKKSRRNMISISDSQTYHRATVLSQEDIRAMTDKQARRKSPETDLLTPVTQVQQRCHCDYAGLSFFL
jgi:hypothetical protein